MGQVAYRLPGCAAAGNESAEHELMKTVATFSGTARHFGVLTAFNRQNLQLFAFGTGFYPL